MPNGSSTKRQQAQESTRSALRLAAAKEFARRGVGRAAIDTIAASAGYTRGAFYANYSSKHELILEILREIHEVELQAWSTMIRDSATPNEMFDAIAQRVNAFVARSEHAMLVAELRLEAQRNPAFASHYVESHARLFDLSIGMVEHLAAKTGSPLADPLPVALALRALAVGLEFDFESRRIAAPSAGEIVVMFLKRMLQI